MNDILMNVNWLAVIAGTVVAFVLGIFRFGQIFGKAWSAGSHNIQKLEKVPVLGLSLQILGTFSDGLDHRSHRHDGGAEYGHRDHPCHCHPDDRRRADEPEKHYGGAD
jgi:hypothetical protein